MKRFAIIASFLLSVVATAAVTTISGTGKTTVSGTGKTTVLVGGFSPPSSIYSWHKADSLSLANNDPVASWIDSTGNAHDASQATSARRPVYKTTGSNSKPYVSFTNASVQWMNLSIGALAADYTIIAVINRASTGLMGTILGANGGTQYVGVFSDDNAYVIDSGGSNRKLAFPNTGWVIVGFRKTGDACTLLINNTETAMTTNGAGLVGTLTTDTLGFRGTGEGMEGGLAEIFVFSDDLSAPDTASVLSYLNTKYAIY